MIELIRWLPIPTRQRAAFKHAKAEEERRKAEAAQRELEEALLKHVKKIKADLSNAHFVVLEHSNVCLPGRYASFYAVLNEDLYRVTVWSKGGFEIEPVGKES